MSSLRALCKESLTKNSWTTDRSMPTNYTPEQDHNVVITNSETWWEATWMLTGRCKPKVIRRIAASEVYTDIVSLSLSISVVNVSLTVEMYCTLRTNWKNNLIGNNDRDSEESHAGGDELLWSLSPPPPSLKKPNSISCCTLSMLRRHEVDCPLAMPSGILARTRVSFLWR